ncbi:MAG: DUF488 family protein [candidate division KSB1 bacterium]|nr:DUF488 family protein [candidate division KSB1 bacterium]MDZ7303823.1 DUF488 family protein [candidate division KSB1 bacterium]MDZ7312724.1 DUF488 family protein [candidate division KSB1 bacterium]
MLKCKSIYDKPELDDGYRVFVDRLWPEGLSTRRAAVAWWAKELAPSYELWRYGYAPDKWTTYRDGYLKELVARDKQPFLEKLRQHAGEGTVTLLYGTSDPARNNAVIIKEFLENGARLGKKQK